MSVTEHIDQLDSLIGKGETPARLRGYLQTFRQQAEAFEAHQRDLEGQIEGSVPRKTYDDLKSSHERQAGEIESLKGRVALYAQQLPSQRESHHKDIGGGLSSSALS